MSIHYGRGSNHFLFSLFQLLIRLVSHEFKRFFETRHAARLKVTIHSVHSDPNHQQV